MSYVPRISKIDELEKTQAKLIEQLEELSRGLTNARHKRLNK